MQKTRKLPYLALIAIPFAVSAAEPPAPPDRAEWGFVKDLATREAYVPHWTRAAAAGELDFSRGVAVIDGYGLEKGLETAKEDLDAFLADVKLAGGETPLRLVRRDCGAREAYTLEVSPAGATLAAGEDEGMRRAICFFEDRLLGADAPALPYGSGTRKPWVRNRISRCFFGPIKRPPFYRDELMDDIDYYPDAYLNRLAHEGVNGLWLTVEFRDIASTSFTPTSPDAEKRLAKLRRTVAKCRRYGIGTWIFCIEPRQLEDVPALLEKHPEAAGPRRGSRTVTCTSQEVSRKYLEEAAESVFRAVPGLSGIVNISHGERPTTCLSWLPPADDGGKTGCPRCDALPPWQVHAYTAGAMLKGMRRASPSAEFISWFYQPQVTPERGRWVAETVRHLPDGVTFLYNFESGALKEQLGRIRAGGDYWLSYAGPSGPFSRVAEAAAQSGASLGAKIQVGCSHEVATVPFVPVPGLLYRKYRAMKAAGVSTVFQCWYFGNYPGIMNKAAGELSFSDFTEDENAFLERLARPDWGNDAPRVAQLWRRLSDAYAEYPLSNDMQYYGPFHAGVAWPLHAYAEMKPLGRTWKPLDAPSGDVIGEALENHTLDEAMILSGRMAEGAAARLPDGTGEYSALAAKYRGNRARELDAGVMQALALQFESANGIFRFYRDRSEAIDLSRNRKDAQGARKALARMRRTVLREKEIAAAMRALSAADSRLGFHSEAECHQYFPEKFDWRIGELDKTLADIADIDAALGRGEPYPESAFEKNAPRCTIGGGWTAAEGFRFRLEENETGDLTVHVETEARSVAVATFDAAGVQWQKRASIDCAGKTQSALAWNAITPGHAAKGGAKRQDGKWTYSLTLCAEGWNRDTRLRPEWIEISAGGKRWPGLPQPEARLNLGYLQPAICGRIVR